MLTIQQEDAVAAVTQACIATQNGAAPQHFVLEAVAGSGKTRTLACIVERLVRLRRDIPVLLLQFNQEACRQMRERLRPVLDDNGHHIQVHTIHSFGLRLLGDPEVDPDKLYKAWHRLRAEGFSTDGERGRADWLAVRSRVDAVRHGGTIPDFTVRPLTLEMTILEECVRDRVVVDQEDAVYHAVYYQHHTMCQYALVLVDEAQDLNDANHLFLRHCVVPRCGSTVFCAVGDQCQAIYQFRGAHPDSMNRLRQVFCATQLSLTCCFRCPRRVVSVASYLLPKIRAAPTADLGGVSLCKAKGWNALEGMVDNIPPGETILFVARTNRGILNFVRHLYHNAALCRRRSLRWAAPALLAELTNLDDLRAVGDILQRTQSELDESHGPVDQSVHRVLEAAVDVDGPAACPSPFLTFALRLLSVESGDVTLATIHGSKGAEYDHVFLDQYNLIGSADDVQERNLLYIAVTRARKTLTFFMHGRSQYVPSAILPSTIIHMSGDLGVS